MSRNAGCWNRYTMSFTSCESFEQAMSMLWWERDNRGWDTPRAKFLISESGRLLRLMVSSSRAETAAFALNDSSE